MFKEGQKIIVLKLYDLRHDGAGTIIKQFESGKDKGKWLIDVSVGMIVVEENRLVDSKAYWKEKNVERSIAASEDRDSTSKKK